MCSFNPRISWDQDVCLDEREFISLFFFLWTTLVKSEDELMSSALSRRMTTHQAPYGCGLTTTCIHWWLSVRKPRFAWRFVARPWNLNKHPENVLFVKQQRANKWGTRALVCSYSTVYFPFGRIYASLFFVFFSFKWLKTAGTSRLQKSVHPSVSPSIHHLREVFFFL